MNKFQSKENLPIFIKCINLFFASIIIFLILVLFFAIFKIYSEPSGNLRIYIFFLIISLTGIVILIYSFRLQDSYKVNFAIIIFSLGISVYAFEIYLYVSNSIDFYNTDTREYAAKKLGKEFDERSRLEVIDDLNDQGLETYPNYLPKQEYVLYNGVDRTKFYNMDMIKATDKFQIGCIANFWPIKDHINLI